MKIMSNLFFNPRQPRVLNDYDNPAYKFYGEVDHFIYKRWIWHKRPGPADGVGAFSVPDEQYYVKLNSTRNLHFIKIQKNEYQPREWVGLKYYGKPGVEQPISFYDDNNSGGTAFIYDKKNRIVEYATEAAYKGKQFENVTVQFQYDRAGNLHVNSEYDKFEYNNLGQLTAVISNQESDEDYAKYAFEYDAEGRVVKKIEYGYFYEFDENEEHGVYLLDKGILLLNTINYTYIQISTEETKCIREAYFGHDKVDNYRKEVIVFDQHGFKKSHIHYKFDGSLWETSYYNFTFDENKNWIKATVDIAFGHDEIRKDNDIYERNIY
jgi:YD repeat-containing protein